jgi:hypothetical protein
LTTKEKRQLSDVSRKRKIRMIEIKKIVRVMAATWLFLVVSEGLCAQDFTEAQRQVRKNVKTHWHPDMKRDLEGFMGYFLENYRGWP